MTQPQVGSWASGVWNMVFVGVDGAPTSHCSNVDDSPYVTVDSAPAIAEKPFISIDDNGLYYLNIPPVKEDAAGVDWTQDSSNQVSFEQVYVADNKTDTADTINGKLAAGLHLVLSPGIYSLDAPLQVTTDNQVILGLGLATLVPSKGNSAIEVGDVDGVRVAGVLLQAGATSSPTLLKWGSKKAAGDASNPGVMSDIFARVGGPDSFETAAETMVSVQRGNVIGDVSVPDRPHISASSCASCNFARGCEHREP